MNAASCASRRPGWPRRPGRRKTGYARAKRREHAALHYLGTAPGYPTRAGPPRHCVACQIQRFRHPDWRRALVIRPAVLVKFRGFGAQFGPKMRDRSRQLWPTARRGSGGGNASIVSGGRRHPAVDRLAGGRRGDAETRRHALLHDPGRCAAKLRAAIAKRRLRRSTQWRHSTAC